MKSWEVLRDATNLVGVKALAARLRLSAALVYKWCQESPQADPTSSGARNPLDRVKEIFEVTHDSSVINWLCHEAGGFFVQNPPVDQGTTEEKFLASTRHMVEEFGTLLTDISRSIENDGLITTDEAGDIRQSWEKLKTQAERFVVACEQGRFAEPRRRQPE